MNGGIGSMVIALSPVEEEKGLIQESEKFWHRAGAMTVTAIPLLKKCAMATLAQVIKCI